MSDAAGPASDLQARRPEYWCQECELALFSVKEAHSHTRQGVEHHVASWPPFAVLAADLAAVRAELDTALEFKNFCLQKAADAKVLLDEERRLRTEAEAALVLAEARARLPPVEPLPEPRTEAWGLGFTKKTLKP